jgi:hypothetical protein
MENSLPRMIDEEVQDVHRALGMPDQNDLFGRVFGKALHSGGDLRGIVLRSRPAAHGDELDRQALPPQGRSGILEGHPVLREAFREGAGDDQDPQVRVERGQARRGLRRWRFILQSPEESFTALFARDALTGERAGDLAEACAFVRGPEERRGGSATGRGRGRAAVKIAAGSRPRMQGRSAGPKDERLAGDQGGNPPVEPFTAASTESSPVP